MPRSPLRLLFAATLLVRPRVRGPRGGPSPSTRTAPPGAFVDLHDVAPTIVIEMRYRTAHNFLGRRVPGYRENTCILTRQAAEALARVQEQVTARRPDAQGLRLLPPAAVRRRLRRLGQGPRRHAHEGRVLPAGAQAAGSSRTATSPSSPATAAAAPSTSRSSARRRGGRRRYTRGDRLRDCARKAGVRFRDNSIDMGTGYDCFDPLSHTFNGRVKGKQRAQPPPAPQRP